LKIIGTLLSALGALVLAWRVKIILDALLQAQKANDINFRILGDVVNNVGPRTQNIIVGMDAQVERQQQRGTYLLVIGFLLIAVGSILNAISLMIE